MEEFKPLYAKVAELTESLGHMKKAFSDGALGIGDITEALDILQSLNTQLDGSDRALSTTITELSDHNGILQSKIDELEKFINDTEEFHQQEPASLEEQRMHFMDQVFLRTVDGLAKAGRILFKPEDAQAVLRSAELLAEVRYPSPIERIQLVKP